jgi:hypothetical protein
MKWWEGGWERVFAAIEPLQPDDVMRTVTIRGEPHTVLQAVNRQIVFLAQASALRRVEDFEYSAGPVGTLQGRSSESSIE